MNEVNHSRDSRPIPPPETHTSGEASAGENLGRRCGKVRRFLGKVKNFPDKISHSKGSRSREPVLPNIDREGASSTPNITDAPSGVERCADPQSALQDAKEAAKGMNLLSGRVTSGVSAAQNAPADLEDAYNSEDKYLQPLKIFDSVIGELADLHPYAKVVLGLLSYASKIVLAQTDRDKGILRLLEKLGQVYDFMMQDKTLGGIQSMQSIVGRIVQQTLECSQFIKDYSTTKNFWKRLGKNVISETENTTQQYTNVLDALMQSFRDQVTRDVEIFVYRTGETLDLSGMAYAEGAGLDTGKLCLPGTRTEIISEIMDWVNSTGDDVQRVLWLSGPAGKGKSAIAHTIANWFNDVGGLGSCYCFDHQRDADRRHEKIFSTIARDLADRDPEMRRSLAEAVKDANSLKTTADIVQQWDKLLMKPLGKLSGSIVRPVVIVIDALDESGGAETRFRILRILAGKLGAQRITELPANFRIIITSRPIHDIDDELHHAQHIRRMSMDDIPLATAERDIYAYVSRELEGVSDFGSSVFTALAKKADGLFEWARLACEHIKKTPVGVHPISRFNAIVNRDPEKRKNLLYDIYQLILTDIMQRDKFDGEEYEEALTKFCSVMGQILSTVEPLPMDSLNAMRSRFPDESERYKVEIVVGYMGSLLSGTTNSSTPIRPIHASFRDFLTDQLHSGEFFVNVSKIQRDLAFASLRVMEHELSFNICDLKSSYLPNSEDPGLRERVEKCILPHLSYACRFWPIHVQATDFDPELAEEIKSFFDHERLFFWLEVLCLINALSGAVPALPLIARWLKGHTGYEDASSVAMDMQRFIQIFGSPILHSTPHLYVSALPFSPVNSALSKIFSTRFPNSLHLASGRDINWTAVQTVISGHTRTVHSVSFSKDGTRIATGSDDRTVRLWDAATGQPVGVPLLGHTSSVTSVSFSPDGTRIVSGSRDNTVRLWDVATCQPIGEPLSGHINEVNSVSFSLNGTRIVSGSADKTVRLWNAATRQPIGEPLRGHTDRVSSASFSPDGTRIVSGSWDDTVRLWDAGTGQPAGEPLRGHTMKVRSVSFSPDGTRIASGSDDRTVRLWNPATGKPVCEPFRGHTDQVRSVSFSPDGSRIVTGSDDHTVRLWEAATGQPACEPLLGHTDWVRSVSFSPDGTRIATGSTDRTIRLWDAATWQPVGEPLRGHTSSIFSVSLSLDGTHFATGSEDGTVQLLDAVTGQPVGEPLRGHTGAVLSVSFSLDGTRIISGSSDRTIRLWDAGTRESVGEPFRGHTGEVNSVSFSPDGTRFVSCSNDKTARLWDVVTGQPVGEPLLGHTESVNSVSFSPNGDRIVTGSADKTIRLWDAGTGQPVGEPLEGHNSWVNSVSFSPDGSRIVSGSDDQTVRLWDTGTGQPVGEPLEGNNSWVNSVSFSPDKTCIVSGSSDQTVCLRYAATGQPICRPLRGHTSPVRSVSFSQNGTRIISCSLDGTVRVWYAAIGKSLQDHAEEDCSTSSLHGSYITHPTAAIPTSNTTNDDFISFSSNSAHALCDTAELLADTPHDDRRSTFAFLGDDGWMMGPNRRLLFWVPPSSRKPFYNPWTAFVIPRGGPELDLSRMAHGTRWQHCYEGS
ncbi:WD40 repeat-like protein [Suillus weaverae]|nr:WD40 repeat-like protein [Suillus weaverae]